MENQIYYCFGYSEEDITQDVLVNKARSLIMERIMAEKKSNGCSCAEKNPSGR